MVYRANSGHVGGSLGATELVVALYHHLMKHDPRRPDWPERDRFILSKGHCTPVIYAVLAVVLAGAGTVTLLYAILREHFYCTPGAALLTAVTLAFATTLWKYSTTMYSHSAAGFFNVLVVYLALRVARQQAMPWPMAPAPATPRQ